MFSSMTVKQKIWGYGLLGFAFAMAIAAAGYWGQQQMRGAMSDVMVSSAAQKNQMQADMMHDALRADVLAALLAGQKPETERAAEEKPIFDNLREHASVFRASLGENRKLPLDGQIKQKLAESEAALNAYIIAAETIVTLALKDAAAAQAQYPDFIKSFEAVESSMAKSSELIESAARQAETERYGHYSVAGEFVYDHPFQWGSKRTGPDLARGGGRCSLDWHRVHLINPRDVVPESNMPGFPWLAENTLDGALTAKKMETMRTLGVPYTDADIAGAQAAVAGKTELEALIAYLQNLGTAIKTRR